MCILDLLWRSCICNVFNFELRFSEVSSKNVASCLSEICTRTEHFPFFSSHNYMRRMLKMLCPSWSFDVSIFHILFYETTGAKLGHADPQHCLWFSFRSVSYVLICWNCKTKLYSHKWNWYGRNSFVLFCLCYVLYIGGGNSRWLPTEDKLDRDLIYRNA